VKVLIVGGGGREHALAWKLKQEAPDAEIVAAPGNPGIAALGRCVPVSATDVERLVALAEHEQPDFTLVGPEAPLALGIVDRFRERRLPIFGPTKAAAQVETSKAFAKQLMLDAGVPTAVASRHTNPDAAKRAARDLGAPVVIKASGLAAGKGVIVCQSPDEADRAIDFMLRDAGFGAAGAEILVEEFMDGEELSIFYLTDGTDWIPLFPAQDHKRLLDGDEGPNTGGMGAYAPVAVGAMLEPDFALPDVGPGAAQAEGMVLAAAVAEGIVTPTLAALREQGSPFTGVLYAGLMLTADGPKVVEFNCRFGDPETQAVLPAMRDFPLGDILRGFARGEGAPSFDAAFAPYAAVATVLAAAGYPDKARTGDRITLPPIDDERVLLFHAGTARNERGELVTAGGRVLAVTGLAETFEDAKALSTRYSALVGFEGKQFRTDIGWREVARRARAS
jgi:phosphoribosylamine---glycine ligase